MALDDDRPTDDVLPTGDELAPDRDRPRRRLALLALAVPVVAVAVVLGVRATGAGQLDPDAAQAAVERVLAAEVVARGAGEGAWSASGVSADAERSLFASSSEPEPDPRDVTVVCASEGGAPAHLTVRVAGETVVQAAVACSDGADTGAEPAVTTVPAVDLDRAWSFEVAGETYSALAVLVS
ncbi:hypothetical protein [Cellulomonas pakistanensis]|uniref:Uncharacterized protein n=1 Tax=Cellulomonas pakistanensis TaxID=992287 RepID=A0A919PG08_9CELL|nr:hypothetical protein [Cellulomonas pakistanensis]GIG37837.1 hypothetical protein Cpa01nite_32180 [Cellulomonas pakistanensis]